jgi:hypothetical protein
MPTDSIYQTDSKGKIIGYFYFDQDQYGKTTDGERNLTFETSNHPEIGDPVAPIEVQERVYELLSPHFHDFEVGICESMHSVNNCIPAEHAAATELIRKVLVENGWTES